MTYLLTLLALIAVVITDPPSWPWPLKVAVACLLAGVLCAALWWSWREQRAWERRDWARRQKAYERVTRRQETGR